MLTTYDSQIETIVQSIFTEMLGSPVTRLEGEFEACNNTLVAFVQITGAWVGSVVLFLSPQAVRSATAAMLCTPADEVTESDQQDVAAELANMIGGNLKSLLPGPSSLSLPIVVIANDFHLKMHHANLIDEVLLESSGNQLKVEVYQSAQDA